MSSRNASTPPTDPTAPTTLSFDPPIVTMFSTKFVSGLTTPSAGVAVITTSPPSISTIPPSRRTLQVGVHIGVSLAVLAAVIIGLLYLRRRKRRRKEREDPQAFTQQDNTHPVSGRVGSVRPFLITQASSSTLLPPSHSSESKSSKSIAAASTSSSKTKKRPMQTAGYTGTPALLPLPLIPPNVALDSRAVTIPPPANQNQNQTQNAALVEQLQALQERVHEVEAIARMAAEGVMAPPDYHTGSDQVSIRSGERDNEGGG